MPRYTFILVLVFGFGPFAWADEPVVAGCAAPSSGPVWLQDFTEEQKRAVELKWEPTDKEKPTTFTFKIEGRYPEAVDTSKPYSKYRHLSQIEATETYACHLKDKTVKFQSIQGTVKTELVAKWEEGGTKDFFETEDKFAIRAANDYRQTAHESSHEVEVRTATERKEFEESLEWKQTWNEQDVPFIQGKLKEKSKEEISLPSTEGRSLASPVAIPGFEPSALLPGIKLRTEKEVKGVLGGPVDPISVVTKQTVKQVRDEKVIESKELRSEVTTQFGYNVKAKKYDFLKSSERYDETVINPEKGFKVRYSRLDTWTNPEAPPTQTSFWKESFRKSKFGSSSEITLSSKGHGLLPKLFHLEAKEGTYSRITEYSSSGRIIRFLVLFFPVDGKENQTLMDLQFSEAGNMSQFTVMDDEINAFENPFENSAALYALQSKVARTKEFEGFTSLKDLPARSIREADYPVVYVPAEPAKKD